MSFPWPNGEVAAISLSFDDGMRSQLEIAAPMLTRHGLCGTFYINPGGDYSKLYAPWRAVAAAGHEVANHTISHPCSKNFQFISQSGRRALEDMSFDDMAWEIDETNRRLQELFPDQGPVSFGYPCYQPFVGKGASRQSYVPVVLERCVAGRGRGERANDPQYCDLGYLWSFPCERMTGAAIVGLVEQTAVQARWGIMTFHGVNEGHLPVSDGDLEELYAHLSQSRDRVWVAPVAEVAQWVATHQQSAAAV